VNALKAGGQRAARSEPQHHVVAPIGCVLEYRPKHVSLASDLGVRETVCRRDFRPLTGFRRDGYELDGQSAGLVLGAGVLPPSLVPFRGLATCELAFARPTTKPTK
jgi:hypothetical protein